MRRLSQTQKERQKRYLLTRWRRSLRRRRRLSDSRLSVFGEQRREAAISYRAELDQLPSPQPYVDKVQNRFILPAPRRLCLNDNRLETLGYLRRIPYFRYIDPRGRSYQKYYDFDGLREISLSALLVLAAELDCAIGPSSGTRKSGRKIGADTHRWSPQVHSLFDKFGLLDLLRYEGSDLPELDSLPTLSTTRFCRSNVSDGSVANRMITNVCELASQSIPADVRHGIYIALAEAMDNASFHAYPNSHFEYPPKLVKKWWGVAAYDSSSDETIFMVYDRGVGIHETIPLQGWFQSFKDSIGADVDEAKLIEVALKRGGKSSTGLLHRGKGLPQMYDAIKEHPGSYLRIHSGRVLVHCDDKGDIRSEKFAAPIKGTLIEWVLSDRGHDERN